MNFELVYDFWFKELKTSQWYKKDEKLDDLMRERFTGLHTAALKGELYSWRETPKGAVSEIILLDQFSRNMFRNTPKAFAQDSLALVLAQEAISRGDNEKLETKEKSFLYMPFMHSESLIIHEKAVELFSEKGLEGALDFEYKHKVIIEKFGRYPHRNKILGRQSTKEEIEFLKQPGSSF